MFDMALPLPIEVSTVNVGRSDAALRLPLNAADVTVIM
jgi:hypothetical protein